MKSSRLSGAKIENGINLVNEWLGWLVSYILPIMTVLVVVDVIGRTVFAHPIEGAMELQGILQLSMAMLAGGYCLKYRQHVKVDIIWSRFSPRSQAIIDMVTSILFFFFAVLLTRGALIFASGALRTGTATETLRMPMLPIYIIVVLGGILIILQGIVKFAQDAITASKATNQGKRP